MCVSLPQILMMSIAVMALAAFGFLSPANRGGMATALLLLYVFMGSFAGYYSARLYKMYGGTQWKRNTLATAFFFPVQETAVLCYAARVQLFPIHLQQHSHTCRVAIWDVCVRIELQGVVCLETFLLNFFVWGKVCCAATAPALHPNSPCG